MNGNVRGLLQAYSVGALLSMHHVLWVDPVFPNMSHIDALQRLTRGMRVDPLYFLETAVAVDANRSFTVVVSWGYSVQISEGDWRLADLQRVEHTFRHFGPGQDFVFNVRDEIKSNGEACALPIDLWIDEVRPGVGDAMESVYSRSEVEGRQSCPSEIARISQVRVVREGVSLTKGLTMLRGSRIHDQWQCCRSLAFDEAGSTISIVLGSCSEVP